MSTVNYNGSVINEALSEVNHTLEDFSSLSSEMKQATNKITSARGFQEYIGGLTSDSFSSVIEECENNVQELVHSIRQKQVKILAYSEDKEEIKKFLDSLSRLDYKELDLTELEDYISVGTKVGNIFKGALSSLATAGIGLVEGIMDFGETGADLLDLGRTAIASIFVLDNKEELNKMWEETKARVAEKKVENIFDNMYKDTELGQFIKNNAYGYESVRGISKGLGYTAGIIGLNIVTGGLASGGIGAAGSVTAGGLGATAGALGFANGTEEAWADGASLKKGLIYGAATGVWEGAQWFAGAKINQIGGLGDQLAKGLFKGAKAGVGIRIGLDTVTAGLDAFARPGLSMIYKDYDGATISEKYKTAFQMAGGWKNVATQAAIGGIASAVSEYTGARRLLKEADAKQAQMARDVFSSEKLAAEGITLEEALKLEDDALASGDFSKSRLRTIDGEYIRTKNTPFNSKGSGVPGSYRWFGDGAYVPPGVENGVKTGLSEAVEGSMSGAEMIKLIEANKTAMSGAQYTRLLEAAEIFQTNNVPVNTNTLKLVLNHSEGNLGRIREAVKMSSKGITESEIDLVSDQLAKKIFKSNNSRNFTRTLTDTLIDDLRAAGNDSWESSTRIVKRLSADNLIRITQNESTEDLVKGVQKYFGPYLSDETIMKIASSDGYPQTIKKILLADGTVPESLVDTLSNGGASRIFRNKNTARLKAVSLVQGADYDTALKLTGSSSLSNFDANSELLKATHAFNAEESVRRVYYHIFDDLKANGLSARDATMQARMIDANALTSLGEDATFLFKSIPESGTFRVEDTLYRWNKGLMDNMTDTTSKMKYSQYTRDHYVDGITFDSKKMVADFRDLMARRQDEVQKMAVAQGLDPAYSKKAADLFTDAYAGAVTDTSNPSRKDAIAFISKMLELDSEGKPLSIVNDAARSGSNQYQGRINLANTAIDGNNVSTMFHENGHYVFESELGARYPQGFDAIRDRAVKNLSSTESASLLQQYNENARELQYYSNYKADKTILESLNKNSQGIKFTSIDQYEKYRTGQYQEMSESARKQVLGEQVSKKGSVPLNAYDKELLPRIDYKRAQDLASIEVNAKRAKVQDIIFRNQFGDYEKISSVIDSATMGDTRYNYGHGIAYFESKPDPNTFCYHELIADYSAMKLQNRQEALGFLRKVLGDEFMDTIDSTYREMLK